MNIFLLLKLYKTIMPFAFNKQLWEAGRKIEDDALPKLNKYFKTPLYCGVFFCLKFGGRIL